MFRAIHLLTDPARPDGAATRRARLLAHALGANLRPLQLRDLRGPDVRRALREDAASGLLVLGAAAGADKLQALALRHAAVPVLVARSAEPARYARILATVQGSASCGDVVRVAAAVDPDADIEIFHAVARPNADRPHDAAWHEDWEPRLPGRTVSFSDSWATRRNRVLAEIGCGHVGDQAAIQQEQSGADLIVLRAQPRSWPSLFRRGVVERALDLARSDVLVLPADYAPCTRDAARCRLVAQSQQRDGAAGFSMNPLPAGA